MIEEFYKKKIIRDFLSLFSESKWKELLFLLVEYGILQLRKDHNVASMSIDDLNNIIDDLKEEENKRLRKNKGKFDRSMSKDVKEVNIKPSSNWRKGDESRSDNRSRQSSRNNSTSKKIYPEWWAEPKAKRNMVHYYLIRINQRKMYQLR
jgi:hypothetical protein